MRPTVFFIASESYVPGKGNSIQSKSSVQPELTSIFESVEFHNAYRISYLANAITVPAYEDIKRDFGIIRSEYLLLLCLAHLPVLTAQDVSTMTRRPRNSISRAVHRLLSVGYLNRVPDPQDSRQAKLSITPAGRVLHKQIARTLVARETELLSPLSNTEKKEFQRLLQKLSMHASTLQR